jgi:undecaprenyl-diphosphatase
MNLWDIIILGLVEGLTEFLPISSTFHLIFVSRLIGAGNGDFTKLFNVFIQSGAILAVVVLYWKRLEKDFGLVKRTLAAFIPTALLGILAYRTIKRVFFESYLWMIGIFVLVGVLFLVFESLVKTGRLNPQKSLAEFSYKNALIIGLAQCLAFFPGVSRAGAVILVMMVLGYRRDEAAVFSFLLAIPTIFAAAGYDLYKSRGILMAQTGSMLTLLLGFAVAFIVAYLAVRWFIHYLQHHTLRLFGIYRIVAGGILLLLVLLR